MDSLTDLERRLAEAEERRRAAERGSDEYEQAEEEVDALRRQIWLIGNGNHDPSGAG